MAKFTACCQEQLERMVNEVALVVKRFDDIQFDAAQKSEPMSLSKTKTVDGVTQGREQDIMARLDALVEQVGKLTKKVDKLMEHRSISSEESFYNLTGTEGTQEAQDAEEAQQALSSDSMF